MSDQEPLTPLRELTLELTQKYITQIVKESTKQAIRKQGIKLSKSQLHKFEDQIKNLKDKEKLEKMREPLEQVKQTITQEGIQGTESIHKLSNTINKGMDTKIPLGMSLKYKSAITAAIIGLGLIIMVLLFSPSTMDVVANQLPIITSAHNNTICKACNGTGYVTCPHSNGVNVTAAVQTVLLRQGSDVAEYYPITEPKPKDKEVCSKCGGTGKIKCTKCKGDGKLNPGDPGY